ncbi:MAG TPA: hypothetical protein VFV58_36225 [Blastocatellia bacterium]|jgi:hypothetical protein|nr:hypothetical protein [Blastocatellia bacterium]
MAIPQDFYTTATLFSLSGSASAVWIITSLMGYLLESKASKQFKKWFGLILSIALSLLGATLVKEQQSLTWVVGVVNGFLIYITAIGANTITEKAATAGRPRKRPVRETSADKAGRGNFTEAWW